MARVLYIDHYAGSIAHGMEFRPFYMAREWMRLGHEVTVVAATESHLRQRNPVVTDNWTEELVSGVRYVWLKTPSYLGNGLSRVRNMLAFVRALYRERRRLAYSFSPDVVIASSTYPFDIFPARSIARLTKAKLVFELHDLWPLSPIELGGMSRWHPFIIATQFAEDHVCRVAEHVVSMLPKAEEHLTAHGLRPGRFVYIPNGFVLEEWTESARMPLPAETQRHLAELRAAGRFIVLYAGAHGLLNNLGILLASAERLRDDPISIVLVGHGPEKTALVRAASERGLDNVSFLPSVPRSTIPALLAAADCLFLSYAPQPLFRFGVSPNKLMDYLMSGTPVVAAMAVGNNLVEESGCGFTVGATDPDRLAVAFRELAALPTSDRHAMGERGRRAVRERYSYETLARRFAELFTSLPMPPVAQSEATGHTTI